MESAHAHLFGLGLADHLHCELFIAFGQIPGNAAEIFRVAVVGGQVAQVPRQVDADPNTLAGLVGLGQGIVLFPVPEGPLAQFAGRRRLAAVLVEAVNPFLNNACTFTDLPLQTLREAVVQHPQGVFDRAVLEGLDGIAQQPLPLLIAGLAVAGAHQQDTVGTHAFGTIQPGLLTFFTAEVAGLDQCGELLAGGVGKRSGKIGFLAHQYDQGIGLDFVQWPVAC